MKKWICLLMTGVLLLSVTACKKPLEQTPEATDDSTYSTKESEMTASGIQKEQTEHTYTLIPSRDDPSVKLLTVTDKTSGKEIQTIPLEGNEWFIPEPIYTDITFDGNKDILVPFQRPASAVYFAGFMWNGKTGQYVHAPRLEAISNIAVDMEKELLLSYRTASQITNYSMYRYNAEKMDFEPVRGLLWKPEENGMSVMEFTYTDGNEEQIKRFCVPAADTITPDKRDANMAPYYVAGSVWDLDSEKWKNTVYMPKISQKEQVPQAATEDLSATDKQLLQVLRSQIPFFDKNQSGENVYLKDYAIHIDGGPVGRVPAIPDKYALVDMDSNGTKELIVYVAPDFGFYMIFYLVGETVYGNCFAGRGMTELKTDGMFTGSSGAGIITYSTLSFPDGNCRSVEKAYKNDMSADKVYRIDGKAVTAQEFAAFDQAFKDKPSVQWYPFS